MSRIYSLPCKCAVQLIVSARHPFRCARTHRHVKKWKFGNAQWFSSLNNVTTDEKNASCVQEDDSCEAEKWDVKHNSLLQPQQTSNTENLDISSKDFSSEINFHSFSAEDFAKSQQNTAQENIMFNIEIDSAQYDKMILKTKEKVSSDVVDPSYETCTEVVASDTESVYDDEIIDRQDSSPITTIKTSVSPSSYNLAPFVNESQILSNLVKLGVDLSEIEKIKGASDFIIKLDFEQDIKPYILFLNDIGVSDVNLGVIFSRVPFLFSEPLQDLEVRINYLKAKKFNESTIQNIVSRAPRFLLMKSPAVDGKLGYYQKEFLLTGDEVRNVMNLLPKLLIWEVQRFKDVKFYMKEFLGFSRNDLKKMFLTVPKVFMTDKYQLGERFDFLFNTMEIPHKHIVHWPLILRTRLHVIHDRHRFLLSLNRAQYDPQKVNYVPLSAFAALKDEDFCGNAAKVPISQFDEFLLSI